MEFSFIIFSKFYEKHDIIDKFINIISEIDCLCALSYVSFDFSYGDVKKKKIFITFINSFFRNLVNTNDLLSILKFRCVDQYYMKQMILVLS